MQMIIDFFLDWKVKLTILVLVVFAAFSWHTVKVKEAVTLAHVEVTARMTRYYSTKIEKLMNDSANTQKELNAKYDTQLKEKDAKHKSTIAKYNATIDSLRNRPERPSTSSSYGLSLPPGTKESSLYVDGSRLYYNDARFLGWYAARTEGLKIELQSCYSAYDTARDTLEKFKREHQGM